MKRLLIIIMAICVLGSTGCGKKTAASSTDSNNDGTSAYESGNGQITNSEGESSKTTNSGVSAPDSAAHSSRPVSDPPTPTTAPTPTITPIPTIKVVIPEGFSASQIGDRLEAKGVCKKADFLATINSYYFSYYSLVSKIPADANPCFKLEGYLFPETYLFYLNMKPQDVIGKMLRVAEDRIGSKYSYTGMSTNDIIILASIIQKEAASLADMQKVSAVFHNRLKKGMRLEADPTIFYVEQYLKPNISGDKNRYNASYNTYKCSALPAGAICNPGDDALKAAVSPADTTFLYFVTDSSGKFYFANTLAEHIENCKTAGVTPPAG